MIRLEMTADQGHMELRFDAPDKPGETVRLDELAVFGLYLDVIKNRIVELTNRAVSGTEGYDLVVKD
jgi:hypothetical protein